MGLFDDVLKSDQTIIKNENALDFEFIPKLIPHREKEQFQVASCVKPLLAKRNGRNLVIHGPPGVGKTVAVRHVLKELEEQTEEVNLFYVNCWKNNSSYKIALEICEQFGFKFVQNKKASDLFKVIAAHVNKSSGVFVFDEIDKIEEQDFLYFVLEEIYKKSVILITNFNSWLLELDERIKSRLMPELMEFKQYNRLEVDSILRQRITYAFFENVWKEEAINKVVDKAAEIKDIRSGIFLLKEAALQAEERSSKKVEAIDAEKAIGKLTGFTAKNKEELEEEAKFILEIVSTNSGKKIGDLFRIYQEKGGKMVYKTFQRKIHQLDEGSFVTLKRITGNKGNTTIVNKKLTEY
ncbi:MAG: AAA family ATPase [Nanoarchaeota archaeon]